MYKVLHIMAGADSGGISMVVLNYYRHMNRDLVHFDVAITTDQSGKNAEEFINLGCHIFRLPLKSRGIQQFEKALADLLVTNKYDAIHVHENETSYVALRVAKRCGVKQRIAHSHTTAPGKSLKDVLRRYSGCFLNYYYATNVIACGELAGRRVFGRLNMRRKKALVLPNAIDTSRFSYNRVERNINRRELGLCDQYVIGMVGRLSEQKNHLYAMHLMKQIHKIRKDAVLLLVGNGEDEEYIRQYISDNQMDDYVKMLGRRNDVAKLYQAFDVLLMPSLYEGFPVAAVEAIACGLPIVLSTAITKELSFSTLAHYVKLGNDSMWINKLLTAGQENMRESHHEELKAHSLDIRDTASILQKVYLVSDEVN